MNIQRGHRLAATCASLALVFAACGEASQSTPNARLAVNSEPAAKVIINGSAVGQTPLEVEVAQGKNTLRLEAPGFAPHEETITVGDKPEKVERVLTMSGADDLSAYEALAKVFEIAQEPYEASIPHRGGDDKHAVLYWPVGDVRLSALKTARFDLSADFGHDGVANVVFRRGRKVLFEQALDVENLHVLIRIPDAVTSALKPGDDVEWGIEYADKKLKKHNVLTKFEVASADRVDKAIEKLTRRKSYQTQPAIVQELYIADTLRDKRLYSEALVQYLGIVHANSDSSLPFKGMVQTMQRMKLQDSGLFQAISPMVGGSGKSGAEISRNKGLSGGDVGGGLSGVGGGSSLEALGTTGESLGLGGTTASGGLAVDSTSMIVKAPHTVYISPPLDRVPGDIRPAGMGLIDHAGIPASTIAQGPAAGAGDAGMGGGQERPDHPTGRERESGNAPEFDKEAHQAAVEAANAAVVNAHAAVTEAEVALSQLKDHLAQNGHTMTVEEREAHTQQIMIAQQNLQHAQQSEKQAQRNLADANQNAGWSKPGSGKDPSHVALEAASGNVQAATDNMSAAEAKVNQLKDELNANVANWTPEEQAAHAQLIADAQNQLFGAQEAFKAAQRALVEAAENAQPKPQHAQSGPGLPGTTSPAFKKAEAAFNTAVTNATNAQAQLDALQAVAAANAELWADPANWEVRDSHMAGIVEQLAKVELANKAVLMARRAMDEARTQAAIAQPK